MVRIKKEKALISKTISTVVNGRQVATEDSDTSADEIESDHKDQKDVPLLLAPQHQVRRLR